MVYNLSKHLFLLIIYLEHIPLGQTFSYQNIV
jgi:hypothetical protein